MTFSESSGCRSGQRGVTAGPVGAGLPALPIPAPASRPRGQLERRQAPHLSLGRTLVSLDLSAIGAGQAGAYRSAG